MAGLVIPLTAAVNCTVEPAQIDVLPGEMLTCTVGTVIVTLAELEALVWARLVAVTVTVGGLGTVAGAV